MVGHGVSLTITLLFLSLRWSRRWRSSTIWAPPRWPRANSLVMVSSCDGDVASVEQRCVTARWKTCKQMTTRAYYYVGHFLK
uniref:RxLR effector candidate protein n=1 Tax=Hyaloperonospora arabidopsidis (strain Emoy2) TaxID=559515 RepID=M4BG77_HYAAE